MQENETDSETSRDMKASDITVIESQRRAERKTRRKILEIIIENFLKWKIIVVQIKIPDEINPRRKHHKTYINQIIFKDQTQRTNNTKAAGKNNGNNYLRGFP